MSERKGEEMPIWSANALAERATGAAVYKWSAVLNRWTECHAVLLTLQWPAKPDFHAALPSQVAIFAHEAVRSGGQRPAAALEFTD
jgi:hypothetical protein